MATVAAARTWQHEFSNSNSPLTEAMLRANQYKYLWSWYSNSIYEDSTLWQAYRSQYRLYRYTRSLYNPCRRLVDFYASSVYPGTVHMPGGQISEDIREAIPLNKDASPALVNAISQFYQWSNWQTGKSLMVTYGAALGDVLVEVVDDVNRGKVIADIKWPGLVKEIDLDLQGNIKSYTLEYDINIGNRSRTYRKEVDKREFRYFLDNEPFNGEIEGRTISAVVENPYGFVPAVWCQHKNLGGDHGAPAMRDLGKWDNLNSTTSMVYDYIKKILSAPVILVGGNSMTGVNQTTKTGVTQGPGELEPTFSDEDIRLLKGPDGADVITIPLQMDQAFGAVDRQLAEIEADHPELTMYSQLRKMSQVTGPAAMRLMGDVAGLVTEAQAQYDQASIKLFQMSVAIAGWRLSSGGWGANPTIQQQRFKGFDLKSYDNGDLDFVIHPRPLFESLLMETRSVQSLAIANLVGAGASLYAAAKLTGLSEEDAKMLQQSDIPTEIVQ